MVVHGVHFGSSKFLASLQSTLLVFFCISKSDHLENKLLLISINFTPQSQPQLPKTNGTFLCF